MSLKNQFCAGKICLSVGQKYFLKTTHLLNKILKIKFSRLYLYPALIHSESASNPLIMIKKKKQYTHGPSS